MEIWLEDVVEQLTLARILRNAETVSGKRIAMILVDNVVEFVIKVHGEDIIPGKLLKRNEWDEKKRHFDQLVSLVLAKTKVSAYSQEILDYHELRNSLYHGTVPITVDGSKVDDYRGIAEGLLFHIFKIGISEDAWKLRTGLIQGKLAPSKSKPGITVAFIKTDDNVVKFESSILVKDRDAIRLVMHGFAKTFGRTPKLDELSKSLNYSGHLIKKGVLLNHISRLRNAGRVQRKELSLTADGRRGLLSKYNIV